MSVVSVLVLCESTHETVTQRNVRATDRESFSLSLCIIHRQSAAVPGCAGSWREKNHEKKKSISSKFDGPFNSANDLAVDM